MMDKDRQDVKEYQRGHKIGTVEIIFILIVLIVLTIIFKPQLVNIVSNICSHFK